MSDAPSRDAKRQGSGTGFLIGVAAAVALALVIPEVATIGRRHHLFPIVIASAFLVSGLTLNTSDLVRELRNLRVLATAPALSLLLMPALAYGAISAAAPGNPALVVGITLIAAAPVTVASGTVMTAIAGGNVPLSLVMCVIANILGVFSIPLVLDLLLAGSVIKIPVAETMANLALTVLLPLAAGQVVQRRLAGWVQGHRPALRAWSQFTVLTIIFNAVAASTDRLGAAGLFSLLAFPAAIALHALFLGLNLAASRLLRLDFGSTAALTIHNSQKTLTISYVVWEQAFATAYPLAIIPCVAVHLTQTILDTVVAQAFRRRMPVAPSTAPAPNPSSLSGTPAS